MITLYGIKNCDSVKKAQKWLEKNQIDYSFHDFRSDGLEVNQVSTWINTLGWETLVNKRSTTWKALDASVKSEMTKETAISAVMASPTLIKRPLLDVTHQLMVGFKEADYQALLIERSQ